MRNILIHSILMTLTKLNILNGSGGIKYNVFQ